MVTRRTANTIFYAVAGILFVVGVILVVENAVNPLNWIVLAAAVYLIVHQAGVSPKDREDAEEETTI
jgi:predicted tellurium resistance membrane protein TerC